MANPDRARVEEFVAGGGKPLPFDTNAMGKALGCVIVSADAQAGELVMACTLGPEFLQGNGVIQGGAVAMMLDFVLALCVMPQLPQGMTCATLSLNVSYLRAAMPGTLRATARVDRATKRMAFTSGRLEDAHGALIATASSVVALMEDRNG